MADLGSSLASVLQVPGLQELLNQSITEQRQAAPLRTAIQQQAVNMLPNSAFARPNISTITPANYATPAPSGGGTDWAKILTLLGAGLAGGGALSKLLGGAGSNGAQSGGNLANLINGLKKLMGGGGNGPLSQPNAGGVAPSIGSSLLGNDSLMFPLGPNFSGPSDPSGGTGVGPGMQDYYDSGGADGGGDSYADDGEGR